MTLKDAVSTVESIGSCCLKLSAVDIRSIHDWPAWNFLYKENLCSGKKKKMWMKQLCNYNVRDFATAYRVRNLFGISGKQAPGLELGQLDLKTSALTMTLQRFPLPEGSQKYLFQGLPPPWPKHLSTMCNYFQWFNLRTWAVVTLLGLIKLEKLRPKVIFLYPGGGKVFIYLVVVVELTHLHE